MGLLEDLTRPVRPILPPTTVLPKCSFPGFPSVWSDGCKLYRYVLWRVWDPVLPYVNFCGLNPSTADDNDPDPTITRDIGFARRWRLCGCNYLARGVYLPGPCGPGCQAIGIGGICKTNLFAWRDTEPADMRAAGPAAIGPDNAEWLARCAKTAGVVVACWGAHGVHLKRGEAVLALFKSLAVPVYAFGHTAAGQPLHPLYLKGSTPIRPIPGHEWRP